MEHVNWFFEKKIVVDIVNELGSPIEIAERALEISKNNLESDRHVFEGLLYYGWIYKHRQDYDYKIYDLDQELKSRLTVEDLKEYDKRFYKKFSGQAGRLEFALSLLNNKNVDAIIQLYRDLNIQILRCETTTIRTITSQSKLIDELKVKLLTCSQNHAYGLNKEHVFKTVVVDPPKLQKHLQNLKPTCNFFKLIVKQLSEIVIILLLLLKIPFSALIFYLKQLNSLHRYY